MHRKMIPVLSSNIEGVQYVGSTLLVTFKTSGETYAYDDVPREIYDGMQGASSKGAYLNQVVKKGGYAFRRLTNEELDAELAGFGTSSPATPRVRPNVDLARLVARYPFLRLAF